VIVAKAALETGLTELLIREYRIKLRRFGTADYVRPAESTLDSLRKYMNLQPNNPKDDEASTERNKPSISSHLAQEIITASGLGHLHLIKWFLDQRLMDAELCGEVLCHASLIFLYRQQDFEDMPGMDNESAGGLG